MTEKNNEEAKKPARFDDLKPTELFRSAVEDFALPVDETDKNKKTVLLAAFVEGGVSWADYVAQHPDVAPTEQVALTVPEVVPEVVPEEKPVEEELFLVKMTRNNLLYETRGHKFKADHPYALVNKADLEYILSREDGFRQAFPSELDEFYS